MATSGSFNRNRRRSRPRHRHTGRYAGAHLRAPRTASKRLQRLPVDRPGRSHFLTLRTSDAPVLSFGDKLDILIALNQDTMNRHLGLMQPGASVLYNKDKIKPDGAAPGVQLCRLFSEGTGAGS